MDRVDTLRVTRLAAAANIKQCLHLRSRCYCIRVYHVPYVTSPAKQGQSNKVNTLTCKSCRYTAWSSGNVQTQTVAVVSRSPVTGALISSPEFL